ncbi:anti-phage dCTP deaminase [Desertibaculum subflavum]|uniref:anti-phage dCTP deaminase n=1 Tax=Desertibaculum subflavum TaxID=2268458 RepID=UPI000E665A05
MSVAPLRKTTSKTSINAPYQSAVRDLAANEFVFAVVGPVGSGTSEIAEALEGLLNESGYDATILKARDVIEAAAKSMGIAIPGAPKLAQSVALQDAGDKVREGSKDNAAVAVGLVDLIRKKRAEKQSATITPGEAIEPDGARRAYILDSLRHPHEVALLRLVYQEAFCLIGVFCHEAERVKRLREEKYRDASAEQIEKFVERDENAPEAHGQKVADTFHLADYFIDNTVTRLKKMGGATEENKEWDVPDQLGRLVDILTHSRIVRPRPGETGMFHAHGARMRSSCLSRQVGAALIDSSGSLIATGTNEVPRAGGGVYGGVPAETASGEVDAESDFRCFVHNGYCSNTREQNAIIKELFSSVEELKGISMSGDLLKRVRRTRIGQLIEFSRAVHAEMDALLSAARSGAKTGDTRLFVTTFPCHNCARHIVSAGVIEVQYIEPYLKSQAIPLHGDAIVTDPKVWVRPEPGKAVTAAGKTPNVLFRPFIGVAPRLYRRAFLKDRDLKDSLTGTMITNFAPAEGHAVNETLRLSYAQVEAKISQVPVGTSP